MTILAAASAEPHHGWGGPLAILIAFAAIGVLHVVLERRKNLSPTPPRATRNRVTAQVSEVPGTDDTDADTSWWGRIVTIDGVRMRRARQVWKTGSSHLPDEDSDEDPADDIDLELDDDPEDLDGWVRRNLERMGYARLVRAGMARWGVSERTVKRRIAAARAEDG